MVLAEVSLRFLWARGRSHILASAIQDTASTGRPEWLGAEVSAFGCYLGVSGWASKLPPTPQWVPGRVVIVTHTREASLPEAYA